MTGERLEPACFSRVWSIVQDEISNLFLTNGIYIVQSIESIISNESKIGDHEELNESVHRLAQKIAELDMWGNEKETILQAMIDLFHENKSEAFAWLSQLGATYVSLCSLGLEPSAQKEVVNRLQDLDLLLDTDLVLAFLCSGEVKHDAVRSFVKTWQRITGNIYVTPCVMEETAYHAWISSNDYDSVWRDLGKYNENDAHHLINNAFVRAFRVESKGRYAPKYWNYYISQFKGTHEYDYSKIEKILQDEHIFLIASKNIDEGFAKTIQDSLIENQLSKDKSIREIDAEELDKYRRDGLLIATLLKQRSLRNTLIVSSSTKLCDICRNHKDVLGRLEPVAPIGAIAYLLTMIPGTNMNLGTLKGILFDTGFADKIKGVERVGLRVLRASEEYLMPFARRATLRRKLDEKIRDLATQIGRRPSDVLDDFEHCKLPSDVTANIIASAVDEIASSKSEKKIWELEQKIKDIEKKRR